MNENDFDQFRNIWTLMSDLYGKSQPSPNTLENSEEITIEHRDEMTEDSKNNILEGV